MKVVSQIGIAIIFFILMLHIQTQNLYAQNTSCQRIAGSNQYDTAAAISRAGWQKSYYAVLVSGEDYADALCAGPLAKKFSAPVLLSERQKLPVETLSELKRLEVKSVIMIGGPKAIDVSLDERLKQEGIGKVEHISGRDRYETAVKIAEKLDGAKDIILASGQSPWDILSISSLAVNQGLPVLLTPSDCLPLSVLSYLQQHNISKTYLIGGHGIIPPNIEGEFPSPVRIGGKNRYETNRLILEKFSEKFDFQKVFTVSEENNSICSIADALCFCSLAGKNGHPVIITKGEIPKVTWNYLKTKIPVAGRIIAVGSESTLPEAIGWQFMKYSEGLPQAVYATAGSSGPEEGSDTISGNVIVTADGVNLKNLLIEGDLVLAESIGKGSVGLDNVTVKGTTAVYGGGPHSIVLNNFHGQKIIVEMPTEKIRLVAQGNTEVEQVTLNSGGILEESRLTGEGFRKVVIESGLEVRLLGHYGEVDVNAGGSEVTIGAGATVDVLTLNTICSILGSGQITTAYINAPGIKLVQRPANSRIREGLTATIGSYSPDDAETAGSEEGQGRPAEPVCRITGVDSLAADGAYKAGNVIAITVSFNNGVDVTGAPRLNLETGQPDRWADYAGGTGTATLLFFYTVQAGDSTTDLDYTGPNALSLNGGNIRIRNTIIACPLTLSPPGRPGSLGSSRNIRLDTSAPTAIQISAQNSIAGGESITFRVTDGPLSEASWENFFNTLKANTGVNGNWIRGIEAGDLSLIPSADGAAADLVNNSSEAATIRADFVFSAADIIDLAGNTAAGNIAVDACRETAIAAVTAINADGYYKAGDKIEIIVTFSGGVTVAGSPLLHLATGPTDRTAVYTRGGNGTAQLIFTYTVTAGDTSPDLEYAAANALDLNGGTIQDKDNGTDAVLILPAPGGPGSLAGGKDLVIDTQAPYALPISSVNVIPGNAGVTLSVAGGPLSGDSWTDIFNEIQANTTAGENWITGITAGELSLVPSADGNTAILRNESALPAAIRTDFVIPAAKVRDKAGNVALRDITVDSCMRAQVSAVTSPNADGFYKAGDIINIEITFDTAVTVSGVPSLRLATGPALYTGGSGTNRLAFQYTVQPGDNNPDLEYAGSDALTGMITVKGETVGADLTLPAPGEAGSLGQAKNIVIDAVAPTAIEVSSQNGIPVHGYVTLTAVGGPLNDTSWLRILSLIKSNTINGNWLKGISATDLTITISADGVTATLNNKAGVPAIIVGDFMIPAGELTDKAGNSSPVNIWIDTYNGD